MKYSERDAKAVLSKHQHKATRQRVGVLLLLMNQKRAFTLKNLTEILSETTDRVTIYRALKLFLKEAQLFGIKNFQLLWSDIHWPA